MLNRTVVFLHTMMTATFIALPFALRNDAHLPAQAHVWFYLPILLGSVVGMVPLIMLAEKYGRMKQVFIGCVVTLAVAELLLAATHHALFGLVGGMFAYFVAFNVLEASLPSLVSRMAPAAGRGTAMGAYSTSQFLGAFCGGVGGGLMHGMFGIGGVFVMGAGLALIWLLLCRGLRFPMNLTREIVKIGDVDRARAEALVEEIRRCDGVVEASLAWDEGVIYLKVDKNRYRPEAVASLLG